MYQKIMEAEVDEDSGEFRVKVRMGNQTRGGMNLILTTADQRRARKEMNFGRPLKTLAQKRVFAIKLIGETINIESLGDNEETRGKAVKKVRRKMSKKSVKVEWKVLCEKSPEVDEVEKELAEFKKELQKDPKDKGMGKSGFKGWPTVKVGDEEKDNELTVIGSFSKGVANAPDFDGHLAKISAHLKKNYGKIMTREVKE